MQLIRLIDPSKNSLVATELQSFVADRFPEFLLHRQDSAAVVEPTIVLLTAELEADLQSWVSQDEAKRLVLVLKNAPVTPPQGWQTLTWPDDRDTVLARLSAWAGPSLESKSRKPAHILSVELSTRITTQRLHYRSGDEETAAASVHTLFEKTRELMEANPEAVEFNEAALRLLNDLLRPYTARWHGWITRGPIPAGGGPSPDVHFRDERLRRKFREELRELQPKVLGFRKVFAALAAGRVPEPALMQPDDALLTHLVSECENSTAQANLGPSLKPKLRGEVKLRLAKEKGRVENSDFDPVPAELLEIQRRRAALMGVKPDEKVTDVAGLALSGGGIRSATFCLGVVQGLYARGLFQQFDYLSTVSGGGYLGTFLSCYLGWGPEVLNEKEKKIQEDRSTNLDFEAPAKIPPPPPTPSKDIQGNPLSPSELSAVGTSGKMDSQLNAIGETEKKTGAQPGTNSAPDAAGAVPPQTSDTPQERLIDAFTRPKQSETDASGSENSSESLALRHLRNSSRYLLNGGVWGLLRIIGVFLTGFATAFIILLTLPLIAAWVLVCLEHLYVLSVWSTARDWVNPAWLPETALLCAGIVCAFLRSTPVSESKKNIGSQTYRLGLALLVLGLWTLSAMLYLGSCLYPHWNLSPTNYWVTPVGMTFAGFLGVLSIYWLFMPLSQRIAQGAPWNSTSTRVRSIIESGTLLIGIITCITALIYVAPPVVKEYQDIRLGLGAWLDRWMHVSLPEYVTALLTGFATFVLGAITKGKGKGGPLWAGVLLFLLTPAFFLIAFLIFASHLGVAGAGDWNTTWAIWVTIAVIAWALSLNVNTFSPYRYYRNRLCECYLIVKGLSQRSWLQQIIDACFRGGDPSDTNPKDSVGTLQRLPLSALGANLAAPYHIINATLNAAASKNPTLRGRDGDFFLFSRLYCGSPLTGYVTTQNMERAEPDIDLGTAMAISGAAASPNMGDLESLKRYRFLLTLFNVRLGYWMRRPGLSALRRPFGGPGYSYFLRELVGAVHERSNYVNISDGGHIENLAAYELLRRRSKFILCVDAGVEPGMECADLMRLQRYAAIDFGIKMEFDPADLTILPTTYSRAYAILIKINYAPGREGKIGWMLYLKLALTGTEPRYVLDYRREHPDFPHQTTGEQIYDEAQFEAYRALGECAIDSLFRPEIMGSSAPPLLKLKDWFQALANNLLPDNDPAFDKKTITKSP